MYNIHNIHKYVHFQYIIKIGSTWNNFKILIRYRKSKLSSLIFRRSTSPGAAQTQKLPTITKIQFTIIYKNHYQKFT